MRREGQVCEWNGRATGREGGLSLGTPAPLSPTCTLAQHYSVVPGACQESTGRSAPGVMPSASPSFSRAALTSPLRCHCWRRSSLRGRQTAASSPPEADQRAEEPFCGLGRASCTAAGASGRTCIRSSWGKSRRNTCRGDALGGLASKLGFGAEVERWHERLMLRQVWRQHTGGSGLALIHLGCSVPDYEAGPPNSCAHQIHQRMCSKHRFLGPTPASLAHSVVGSGESALVTKAPADGCRWAADHTGSGARLPPLLSACVTRQAT